VIEVIRKLVLENSQGLIANNPAVPSEQQDALINLVADELLAALENLFKNPGQISAVMSGLSSSDLVSQLSSKLADRVAAETGISLTSAESLSSQLMPRVMAAFGTKLMDPSNTEITLESVLKHFTGVELPAGLGNLLEMVLGQNAEDGAQQDRSQPDLMQAALGMLSMKS